VSAEEDMKKLHEQIEELERESTDLKMKANAVEALVNDLGKLRAIQGQMVVEKDKTYAELKEEFEGTPTNGRRYQPSHQNLIRSCWNCHPRTPRMWQRRRRLLRRSKRSWPR